MTDPMRALIERGNLDRMFIAGEWRAPAGRDSVEVINPATEAPIARVALGNADDAHAAIMAARAAFEAWSTTPVAARADILDRVRALVLERAEEFAQVISAEMGASIASARAAQVPFAAEHIRVAAENARSFDFLRMRGTTAIVREPIGVCSLITPWNWPLYQITAKVAPALAAGCTVVLKPSELSPLNAVLFAEVLEAAGVPAGVFNLVIGSGADVGDALSRHPEVDMVSITGSTRAGILVSHAAAETVKRVTTELGGKSPNIVLPDADLATAIPPGVAACFRNVGQSCSAPTRMIVPRDRLAEVEKLAARTVAEMQVGDPLDEATTHGPVANRAQYGRVQVMIEKGLAEGARLVCGGSGRPDGLERGFFARPTVFSEVTTGMAIAREEIFGPVLCLIPYDTVEEAVAIANDTEYGLGAHVQGRDLEQVRAVAARIRSGQVHLNYPAWDPQAPFGGYKLSGNGREYGVEGLEEYLEVKAIVGYGNPAL
ncbi:aldehyde dehydrogenase family protein [Croceicoccus sp. BE223]|uniref:aldehyde dehydrogenase family protein n=1 Tax=Croceicoccus sp. BE223 TaxID=2817716 RepID=UPI002856BC94|nr:aldehyde dehydrogenase family protein [Croceicoccus sp. BE223]MDR7101615.1 aldehyde dehydrogenase (NAD+) [Croceicoccus sp. BE223]